MANQGSKKRKEENEKHVKRLWQIILLVNVIYIVVRLLIFFSSFTWRHWVGLALTSLAYKLSYDQISSMAAPAYDATGALIDGGHDLTSGGVCGYLHDIIYITCFVQIASILSDWFWLAYLVVPAFALWMLWQHVLYPYFFLRAENQSNGEDPRDKKKREKMERKQERAARISKGR